MQPISRLEQDTRLDGAVSAGQRLARLIRPGKVRDALNGVWLGHPVHPVLVQASVGAWLSASILDVLGGDEKASRQLVGAGLAAAVPAALAGAADWSEQDPGVRRLGALHALLNTAALGLYAGSLVARGKGRGGLGRLLSYSGLGLATASASVGGHMSYAQSSGASHAATAARSLGSDWIDLGPLDDLPDGRPTMRPGTGGSAVVPLAVVRRGVRVDVFVGPCSHLSGPLYEGTVEQVRGATCLVCPWHGSAFDLDDGAPRRGPAANAQEKLEVRMDAGHVLARLPARDQ
jgi:nitrite reductase/ring-hydroxylating ferredoxin subunit